MAKEQKVSDLTTIDYDDPEVRKTLKETVAKGATDSEFLMFLMFCKSTGLNPFRREAWFIKPSPYTNKRGQLVQPPVQMMTGINGYWMVANRHPQFDGAEEPVWERTKEGRPVKVSIKVWRKDRKFPSYGEALFNEYYQAGFEGKQTLWDKKPSVMLLKVAESIALRKAFAQELGDTYTEEEMPAEFAAPTDSAPAEVQIDPDKRGPFDVEVDMSQIPTYVHYDISKLTEKEQRSAQRYLESENCHFDNEIGYWVAPTRLQKLTSCIVGAGVKQIEPPALSAPAETVDLVQPADKLAEVKRRAAEQISMQQEA